MATEGVYKRFVNVDLFIDVPARGPLFLYSVPVLFRSNDSSTDVQPSYQDVANAITKGGFLPPEVRFSFLKEDGSPVEDLEMGKLLALKAVLRLTKAPDLPRPYLTPYRIGVPHPPHAPSICESVNGSGARVSIDVQGTGTSLDCIMPRQKALDLGLKCLFEDIVENIDYFGLIKCTVPEETILTGPKASEGLLHVYCSKKMVHEVPLLDNAVTIGRTGMGKMKLGYATFLGSEPSHIRCQYVCCKESN